MGQTDSKRRRSASAHQLMDPNSPIVSIKGDLMRVKKTQDEGDLWERERRNERARIEELRAKKLAAKKLREEQGTKSGVEADKDKQNKAGSAKFSKSSLAAKASTSQVSKAVSGSAPEVISIVPLSKGQVPTEHTTQSKSAGTSPPKKATVAESKSGKGSPGKPKPSIAVAKSATVPPKKSKEPKGKAKAAEGEKSEKKGKSSEPQTADNNNKPSGVSTAGDKNKPSVAPPAARKYSLDSSASSAARENYDYFGLDAMRLVALDSVQFSPETRRKLQEAVLKREAEIAQARAAEAHSPPKRSGSLTMDRRMLPRAGPSGESSGRGGRTTPLPWSQTTYQVPRSTGPWADQQRPQGHSPHSSENEVLLSGSDGERRFKNVWLQEDERNRIAAGTSQVPTQNQVRYNSREVWNPGMAPRNYHEVDQVYQVHTYRRGADPREYQRTQSLQRLYQGTRQPRTENVFHDYENLPIRPSFEYVTSEPTFPHSEALRDFDTKKWRENFKGGWSSAKSRPRPKRKNSGGNLEMPQIDKLTIGQTARLNDRPIQMKTGDKVFALPKNYSDSEVKYRPFLDVDARRVQLSGKQHYHPKEEDWLRGDRGRHWKNSQELQDVRVSQSEAWEGSQEQNTPQMEVSVKKPPAHGVRTETHQPTKLHVPNDKCPVCKKLISSERFISLDCEHRLHFTCAVEMAPKIKSATCSLCAAEDK